MEEIEKERALESVERVFRQRKLLLIFLLPAIFILFYFLKCYSFSFLVLGFLLISTFTIFLVIFFIKKKREILSAKTIYLLIGLTFSLELICFFLSFYFLYPLFIFYFKEIYFPATLFFIVFIIVSNPIFNSRKYSYFFFVFCCFLLIILSILDFFNLFPSYSYFPIGKFLSFPKLNIFLFLSICFLFLFVIQFYIENFWEMFRKQRSELEKLNFALEEKVRERTEELEEAKTVLEIKVQARTRELRELAESLDEKVKEKTRELQEKIEELEKFHRLAVGRELKMIELKEEIKRLRKEIENLKNQK